MSVFAGENGMRYFMVVLLLNLTRIDEWRHLVLLQIIILRGF